MSILKVSLLHKSYFGKTVLNGISFDISKGEHLALLGNNGSGKSTLLKILAGIENPDSGEVRFGRNIIKSYLSQHMEELESLEHTAKTGIRGEDPEKEMLKTGEEIARLSEKIEKCSEYKNLSDEDHSKQTEAREKDSLLRLYEEKLKAYNELSVRIENNNPAEENAKVLKILSGLGLRDDCLDRPLKTLSGGERMRVVLARTLMRNADFLMLDEPTNHLDLNCCEWLEEYLSSYKGTLLFVSHDRAFVNRIANRCLVLSGGMLKSYPGNYSDFERILSDEEKQKEKDISVLEEEIRAEGKAAQTLRSHRKMKSFHSREKRVKKLEDELKKKKSEGSQKENKIHFRIIDEERPGDPSRVIIRAESLKKDFPDMNLFSDISFSLRADEKMIAVGKNGCGKSTLMKILSGKDPDFEGKLYLSPSLSFAYMGQYCEFEDEELSVEEELLRVKPMGIGEARNMLASFAFTGDSVLKKISVLSGGERSRLYLCCLLTEKPELLFLDEPTNHLDIESKIVLEERLLEFSGSVFAISHDRYFIEKLAASVLGFHDKTAGIYSSYSEYRKKSAANIAFASEVPAEQKTAKLSSERETAAVNKAEVRRKKASLMNSMRECEAEISRLKLLISEHEKCIYENPKSLSPSDYEIYAKNIKLLEQENEKYLEAAIELESLS